MVENNTSELKMFRSDTYGELELWIATDLAAVRKDYMEQNMVPEGDVPEFRELQPDESLTLNWENHSGEPHWVPETRTVGEWLQNQTAGYFAGSNV